MKRRVSTWMVLFRCVEFLMLLLILVVVANREAPVVKTTAIYPTGADGKSAYEIAVDNGYIGTPQAWLTSLRGADGEVYTKTVTQQVSVKGEQGEKGTTGDNGLNGNDGENGIDGKDGQTPAPPVFRLDPVSGDVQYRYPDTRLWNTLIPKCMYTTCEVASGL